MEELKIVKYSPREWNPKIAKYLGWKYEWFFIRTWRDEYNVITKINFHSDYNLFMKAILKVIADIKSTVSLTLNPEAKDEPIDQWYPILCKLVENISDVGGMINRELKYKNSEEKGESRA